MYDFEEIEGGEYLFSGEVTSYVVVTPWRGNPHECPSDHDFYGYTDFEYVITKLEDMTEEVIVVTHGEDIDIPKDVDEDALSNAILESYQSYMEDY